MWRYRWFRKWHNRKFHITHLRSNLTYLKLRFMMLNSVVGYTYDKSGINRQDIILWKGELQCVILHGWWQFYVHKPWGELVFDNKKAIQKFMKLGNVELVIDIKPRESNVKHSIVTRW